MMEIFCALYLMIAVGFYAAFLIEAKQQNKTTVSLAIWGAIFSLLWPAILTTVVFSR